MKQSWTADIWKENENTQKLRKHVFFQPDITKQLANFGGHLFVKPTNYNTNTTL